MRKNVILFFFLFVLPVNVMAADGSVCNPATINTPEAIAQRQVEVFTFLDKDKSGELSFDEFVLSIPTGPASNMPALYKTFHAADSDRSDGWSFGEWVMLTSRKRFLMACKKK